MNRNRGGHDGTRQRGFSLSEMLVVLFLASVTVLTVFPNLKLLAGKARVSDGARQIQAALQLARMKAINEGSDHVVLFTDTGWNIFIDSDRDGIRDTNEKWIYVSPIRLPTGVVHQVPANEPSGDALPQATTTGCKCIRWQPNGTMRVTGSATAFGAAVGNGREYRRLSVSAAGSIRCQTWTGASWN